MAIDETRQSANRRRTTGPSLPRRRTEDRARRSDPCDAIAAIRRLRRRGLRRTPALPGACIVGQMSTLGSIRHGRTLASASFALMPPTVRACRDSARGTASSLRMPAVAARRSVQPTMTSRTGLRDGPKIAASSTSVGALHRKRRILPRSARRRSARHPAAMAPTGCANRLRAAASPRDAQSDAPMASAAVVAQHVAAAHAQALRPLEHGAISANGEMTVFESLPTPKRPLRSRGSAARGTCRRRDRPRSSARAPPLRRSPPARRSRARSCASRARCTIARRRSRATVSHSTGRMPRRRRSTRRPRASARPRGCGWARSRRERAATSARAPPAVTARRLCGAMPST